MFGTKRISLLAAVALAALTSACVVEPAPRLAYVERPHGPPPPPRVVVIDRDHDHGHYDPHWR